MRRLSRHREQITVTLLLAVVSYASFSTPLPAVRGDRASGWLSQTRSELFARHGLVATSQPLAANAGLDVLKSGGNAFDAAIATAAVLNVVEPGSAGIGGDVFMIAWVAKEHRLVALNGSGRAPEGATAAWLAKHGFADQMPQHRIEAVTVPGAVDAWDTILRRYGTRDLAALLEPAAVIAEEGYAVSERIAHDWVYGAEVLAGDADASSVYLPNGTIPKTGSVFRNPDLARALRMIGAQGRSAFYEGDIANAILTKSRALGGTMTAADLLATHANWVDPITTSYHGYDVYEMPPNTQGFATLEMLNILEVCAPKLGINLAKAGPSSPSYWHLLVEAKKLAYTDLYAFNADPGAVDVPVARLISKDYAATLCSKISLRHASTPQPKGDPVGGTVYLATADAEGNMVSFIYSIYDTFGSGIGIPGFGFVLNNRGALFSLDPSSPNVIAPGKRPFHTLLPGFLMKDGEPLLAFGLMGGSQQAQGHAQVLIDMIDLGLNPQAASDLARFTHAQGTNLLRLETALFAQVGPALSRLGHRVSPDNGDDMGGYQAVGLLPTTPSKLDGPGKDQKIPRVYRGASDHRKDGQAVGW